MVPKPLKSDPLGCLGGVRRPFWSQEGPEELNYEKMQDFMRIWGSSGDPKWSKNRFKNCKTNDSFFITILKHAFINLGWILVPKTSPKQWFRGSFFDFLLICGKCDLERQYIKKVCFFNLEGSSFDFKRCLFQCFFRKCFQNVFFIDLGLTFGRNLNPNGT